MTLRDRAKVALGISLIPGSYSPQEEVRINAVEEALRQTRKEAIEDCVRVVLKMSENILPTGEKEK